MSWGFGTAMNRMQAQGKTALREMMDAAQKEFGENFDTESAGGKPWDDVVRDVPPPILDVTGELRGHVEAKGNVAIMADKAILTVDPLDSRGRGYAEYHMEGTPYMPQREFIVQTDSLTAEQEDIILNTIENAFLP